MKTSNTTPTSFHRSLTFLLMIALLLASNFPAMAEDVNTNSNTNTNTNANANKNANGNNNGNANTNTGTVKNSPKCPSPEEYGQVKVVPNDKTSDGEEGPTVQLEDEVTVKVEHLEYLLAKAKCSNPNKKIVLFLDGRPVKDAVPFPPTDPGTGLLKFSLKRTENSRDVWTYILSESKWTPRKTNVSVGLEDEYPVESTATIRLIVIPPGWFVFWVIVFILLLIAFWLLAWKSDLLRDTSPTPTDPTARKPYSLARSQAAWWFFLVLASYLFIGMITGDFSTTITSTVLGLLGISAGTVVGSAFIDAGKAATPPKPTDSAAVAAGGGGTAAAQTAPYVPKNEYWWVDILSDANGVSFHRFQVAAWTLVLGIIFLIQVYKLLAMPTFGGSLLALLGISAGTFLGLKIPEPTTPTKQGP